MIHIAICDDKAQEREHAQHMLTRYMEKYPHREIKIYPFSNPLELLSYIEHKGGFDILLLDIFMSGMLGIEVARELRKIGDQVEIIFLTSSRDYALDAFEVDAAQYLTKPYKEESFFEALDKVVQRITIDRRSVITLRTSGGITRLATRDVIFTETGRNNYQKIYTVKGKTFEVRMSSSELFELLTLNKYIVRCGASISVNLKYIRQISKGLILFDGGESLPYPYRSYQKLKDDFLSFQMSPED